MRATLAFLHTRFVEKGLPCQRDFISGADIVNLRVAGRWPSAHDVDRGATPTVSSGRLRRWRLPYPGSASRAPARSAEMDAERFDQLVKRLGSGRADAKC